MSKEKPSEFPAQAEQDLEEYGVWVKSGPEDIDEGPPDSPEYTMEDLDHAGGGDNVSLTDEEEQLLAELDGDQAEDRHQLPEHRNSASAEAGTEDIDLDFDLEIDDFDEEPLDLVEDIDDLGSPDLDDEEHDPGSTGAAADSDSSDDVPSIEELSESANFDLERISLPDDEPFPEFSFADSDDSESDDDPLSAENIPELDAETDDQQTQHASVPGPEEEAVRYPAEEPSSSGDRVHAVGTDQDPEQLAGVLRAVQNDLSTIRSEIAEIRAEVAELRTSAGAPDSASERVHPAGEPEPGDAGFFDDSADEDDETIALTGDELDNILNTAEFVDTAADSEMQSDELAELEIPVEPPDDDEGIPAFGYFGDEEELMAEEDDDREEPIDRLNQGHDGELAIEESATEELGPDEDVIPIDLGDQRPHAAEPPDEPQAAEDDADQTSPGREEESGFDFTLDDLDFDEEPDEDSSEPTEELELSESPEELSLEEELAQEQEPALSVDEPETGSGDDEVDALAEMDIDSELAGIEELSDIPEIDDLEYSTDELHGVRFDMDDAGDEAEELERAEQYAEEQQRSDAVDDAASEPADAHATVSAGTAPDRSEEIPGDLREEIRSVLHYMDQLLEALPEEKIKEFAESEHFEVYKRLFEELGLEQ